MKKALICLLCLGALAPGAAALTDYQVDSLARSQFSLVFGSHCLVGCWFWDGSKFVRANVLAVCDSLGGYGSGAFLTHSHLAVTTDLSVDPLGAAAQGTKVLAMDSAAYTWIYPANLDVQNLLYYNVMGKALYKYGPTGVGTVGPAYPTALTASLHPNPFRRALTLKGRAQRPGRVEVAVYNSLGQLVRRLEGQSANGEFYCRWNGQREDGQPAPAGVYYFKVTGHGSAVLRAVKLR